MLLPFLKDLPRTFYSRAFYRRLALEGQGFGLGFLLICTLLSFLSLAASTGPTAQKTFINAAEVLRSLPDVQVSNGLLSVKGETPQTFSLSRGEQETPTLLGADKIRLDPAKDIQDTPALQEEMAKEGLFLLAGKQSFALYDATQGRVEITAYGSKDAVVTHEDWARLAQGLQTFFLPATLASLTGLAFFSHLLTAGVGAVLLLLAAPLFKAPLSLRAALRVSCAAKVPVGTFFLVATPYPPLQVLTWFGFAVFGLLAARGGDGTAPAEKQG